MTQCVCKVDPPFLTLPVVFEVVLTATHCPDHAHNPCTLCGQSIPSAARLASTWLS